MTDSCSIQGSTSSSSDAMSSRSGGGASSNNGVNTTSTRVRVIRMLRPSSRRINLGPENSIAFGFAIRGGKEFNTGFFVSRVEKGSEADLKGLSLGDQIIRVNGYHVEDAVHKEVTQFISSQDRLTLKVRGVGMLPIKEKTLDPLTWHIVPRHTLATTLTALDEHMTIKDIRIVLNVAPKTKLGLGICKGPEWKPGIFVQFTKDFSVARDSGMRPGDQILSCNSIDFSDVLFSEAVAVMKSSQTLEMLVRTGAGLDLFPGESSGYNSSASSVTGDQSPCWGDQSAKRLSMVREEPTKQWIENRNNLDRRKIYTDTNNSTRLLNGIHGGTSNNKTIIQLSESGTLINNTLIPNSNLNHNNNPITTNTNTNHSKSDNLIVRPNHHNNLSSSPSSTANFVLPDYNGGGGGALALHGNGTNNIYRNGTNTTEQQQQQQIPPPPQLSTNNYNKMNGKIADICFVSRQSETKTVIVEVHRSAAADEIHNDKTSNDANIVGVVRKSTTFPSNNNNNDTNVNSQKLPPKPPILPSLALLSLSSSSSSSPSPSSSLTDGSHERSPSVTSSIISSGGTSLCSAISEELKKRKERLSQGSNPVMHLSESSVIPAEITTNTNNCNNITNSNTKLPSKRNTGVSIIGGNDNQRHNALMDEFKRAHRKMFKNGFQETEKERQEELRNTSMMKDETDHRSPSPIPAQTAPSSSLIQSNLPFNQNDHSTNKPLIAATTLNNHQQNGFHKIHEFNGNGNTTTTTNTTLGQFPTPPPPPQFANKPLPMMKKPFNNNDPNTTIIPPPPSHLLLQLPPPETPIPDYDSIPTHQNGCIRAAAAAASTASTGSTNLIEQRKNILLNSNNKNNSDIMNSTEYVESIDSYKLQNPVTGAATIPKPPSAYFMTANSGPPTTMKKTNRPVSVTIGEYGNHFLNTNHSTIHNNTNNNQNYHRKEPSKFDFISKTNTNDNNNRNHKNLIIGTNTLPVTFNNHNNHNLSPRNDENVSNMLRSELEMTLSRSNLKKRTELEHNPNDILTTTSSSSSFAGAGAGADAENYQQMKKNINNHINAGLTTNISNNDNNSKSILNKTQSSNIEKLTNMLQNKQHLFEQNNHNMNERSSTLSSSNRVTITIPNNRNNNNNNNNNNNLNNINGKIELRKTESTPPTPTNGILKNGFNRSSYGDNKSISFGN